MAKASMKRVAWVAGILAGAALAVALSGGVSKGDIADGLGGHNAELAEVMAELQNN